MAKAKTRAKTRAKTTRPKQQVMEVDDGRKVVPEIEKVALEMKELETDRLALQSDEEDKREQLAQLMEKHDLDSYPLPGEQEALLKAKRKAYVRKRKKVEAEE